MNENDPEVDLDEPDKSFLWYIAGATIHSLCDKLERLSLKQVMNNSYRSKLSHGKHQLTFKLIEPPQKITGKSCEPESLLQLIERDYGG